MANGNGCLHVQAHRMGVLDARYVVELIEAGNSGQPLTLLQLAAVLNLEKVGKLATTQFEGWDVFNAVGDVWN